MSAIVPPRKRSWITAGSNRSRYIRPQLIAYCLIDVCSSTDDFHSLTAEFMSDLWPIIASVFGVFIVMIVGAVCRKRHWLTQEADRSLANLTANVLLPAYFIHKIVGSDEMGSLASAWEPPVFGFVFTSLGFGIAYCFAKTLGSWVGIDTESKQRSFALCVGICNYGYIPLPLAEQFYPESMIELILHNVGVDMSLWSLGVAIVSGQAKGNWRRALLSAPLLAVFFASMLRMAGGQTWIPSPVLTAIGTMGGCAIPLGLLLSGAIMVDFMGRSKWTGSWRVIASAIGIRQLLMPVLMLGSAAMLATSVDMQNVMLLQAAMPVAVFPIVLVRLYDRDTRTAIEVIISTSLAGILLIPIWLAIGAWWLG